MSTPDRADALVIFGITGDLAEQKIIPALQGKLGVDLAREHVPDLILLDLHLPDISGEEVLRRLRADERTARVPVMIISADATPSRSERLLQSGAAAFLTKPLNVAEFLETVQRLLASAADAPAEPDEAR